LVGGILLNAQSTDIDQKATLNADGLISYDIYDSTNSVVSNKGKSEETTETRSLTAPSGCVEMPSYNREFRSSLSRGYWFTAQSDFTIKALRVPTDGTVGDGPEQTVQVIRFTNPVPSFPSTSAGTTLFYEQASTDEYIAADINISAGDYIGIIGVRGPGSARNSYANSGPQVIEIDGIPTTVVRFGVQQNINDGEATGSSFWQEPSGPISRVEICTGAVSADEIGCTGTVDYDGSTGTHTIEANACYYANPFNSDELIGNTTEICGDGEIIAEVTSINGLGWAGVTMRETLDPGSKKVQLTVNNGYFARREIRTMTNGPAYPQQFPAIGKKWLRLVRNGFQILGYVSANGISWQLVMASNVSMSDCINVGLVVTGATANPTVTATFNNVSYSGGAPLLGDIDTQALMGLNNQIAQAEQDLSVFPNPVSDQLNIQLSQPLETAGRIDLINANGKVVKTSLLDNATQMDVSELPAGLYIVRMQTDDNTTITKRVVIQ
jgi:hypothetical protein